jgi:hypothetical protein
MVLKQKNPHTVENRFESCTAVFAALSVFLKYKFQCLIALY